MKRNENILPGEIAFNIYSREVLRITPDRKVIVSGDIYEAAKEFWEIVRQLAPEGWGMEVDKAAP